MARGMAEPAETELDPREPRATAHPGGPGNTQRDHTLQPAAPERVRGRVRDSEDKASGSPVSSSLAPRPPCSAPPGAAFHVAEPPSCLVKSTSAEMQVRESTALQHKPLLSLVKSLSTEISCQEADFSQSRSDSRLSLHLWRQRIQPPSGSLSPPAEHRVSFLKAELEDTRRKLSEAMQEPLSVLSKIMGDEGLGNHQRDSTQDTCYAGRQDDASAGGAQVNTSSTPIRHPRQVPLSCQQNRYEIQTFDDIIQVVEVQAPRVKKKSRAQVPLVHSASPVPVRWLFCVGTLAYGLLVLPLSSYLSGLSLGLACGFTLGLLLVLLFIPPRAPYSSPQRQAQVSTREWRDPKVLEGWMNEMWAYDPEAYHPLLTHSVYVSLEGSCLRVAYPRTNILRRATYGDILPEAVFVSHRCFQLAGSKVFLWPPVLARKRMWNQKYPICIMLAREDQSENSKTLYLFGRTGREKEEWFQCLVSASKTNEQNSPSPCGSVSDSALLGTTSPAKSECSDGSVGGSTEDLPSLTRLRDLAGSVRERILLDYAAYMARCVPQESAGPSPSPPSSDPSSRSPSPWESSRARQQLCCEPADGDTQAQVAWVNALLGRIFWDFLREKYWSDLVTHKIQKKLSKIRLPYFMNELTLTELDMGSSMPQVVSTSKSSVDHRGLWLELEVVYTGSLQTTLETKMNLSKLGKESGSEANRTPETSTTSCVSSRPILQVLADSDEESSSAASSDEEEIPASDLQGIPGDKNTPPGTDSHSGGSTSRKILRFVDKIAKSKYFQKAKENEYIKKKMAEVSNTPLLLTVELRELSGTLMVNIPPPPTDRIWYGFQTPPLLDLHVRPMLGEREITLTHVTEWIETKLQREFQKVFVMPNMDDLYLPLMHSGLDDPPVSQQSPARSSRRSSEDSPEKEEDSVSA